jgi:hypothetical protein
MTPRDLPIAQLVQQSSSPLLLVRIFTRQRIAQPDLKLYLLAPTKHGVVMLSYNRRLNQPPPHALAYRPRWLGLYNSRQRLDRNRESKTPHAEALTCLDKPLQLAADSSSRISALRHKLAAG